MPAKSEKQRRFFYLVKGVQAGKISPKKVGKKVSKAAKSMSPEDVTDFTKGKNLPKKKLEEIIECLKNLVDPRTDLRTDFTSASSTGGTPIEPMYLEQSEEDSSDKNPISKTFVQEGNFDQYVNRFSGLEFKAKEFESITNYKKAKPSQKNKFFIRYETMDEFNNNTTTVIKKLREGNNLVFTAFQLKAKQPSGEKLEKESIIVTKSIPYRTDIEGGEILSKMLTKLNI